MNIKFCILFTLKVLEGKPIYVDCYGNLAPLTKGGQQLVFNFYAFKENRLPFSIKVNHLQRDSEFFINEIQRNKKYKENILMIYLVWNTPPNWNSQAQGQILS